MNKQLIDTLDADRRRALENVRAAAVRVWSRSLRRYYTDHTITHSERIITLLDGLTAGMMATPKRLSPSEVFVLLAAAYLHDIGMQDERFADGNLEEIRAHHHEVTAELVYRAAEDPAQAVNLGLPDDPGLVEAVALVAQGHRRVDLHSAEYEPLVHGGETLRLRLLAALLRFGDELDIDYRRVDIEQMKLLALPVESQLHWYKCHYVSGVSIVDEYIRIAYRFPHDRPDYEQFIVPLVEGEVRAKHAALETIFRAHAVKVALGPSQVRLMRPVKPLPAEIEALARQRGGGIDKVTPPLPIPVAPVCVPTAKPAAPSASPRSAPVFDLRDQHFEQQVNVAGDYIDRRTSGGKRAAASSGSLRGERSLSGPRVLPTGPIRDRWALLVGVNRYVDPAFPPLKFCVNDVLALERTLKGLGYTVVALHDDADEERLRPTRDNVEAELARLARVAGPDDLLLAHFACHGKLVDGQPMLVTRETRAPTLARKALPLAKVERQMHESQARRLVLTLDACHTGVEIGRDLADPEFIRHAYELAEGFALIAASTAQQVAQEWKEKEHGVFTYYLLEGLSGQADRAGKRFVTVGDLSTHVLDGLRRWNVEHGGLLQEPTARTEGLGDIILADYRRNLPESSELSGRSRGSNPFGDTGRITDPDRFFGREELLRQIFEELSKGVNLSLVGESQVGKSSLLSMVCALGPEQMGMPPETFAYLNLEVVDDEDDFYAALADRLGLPEPLRGYKLTRALRGKQYVLCLDEIEKMAWDGFTVRVRSQLRGLADGPAAPLKLVIASRSPLAHLFPDSPELDSPLAGICCPLDVGPFPPDVARAFLTHRLRGTGATFTESEIAALLEETGGHPAKLQRTAADLYRRHTQHVARNTR